MSPKRILIVEDEGIVAADLEDRLQRLGYSIVARATSGRQAIAEATRLKPDLILMDIIIEGPLDGVETAEKILSQHQIPVVFLTAHTDEPTLNRAKLTGPFGYVLKPFDERELQVAVEIALYRAQVETQLRKSNAELQKALAEIKTLSGLLPICAWCKKIRNDSGYWQQVEHYIRDHSEAEFTHCICPECMEKKRQVARGKRVADAPHG